LTLVFFGVGAVLEVFGLSIGAIGFRKTWREFSAGGRLFEKDIARLKRVGHRMQRVMRRVLRRPQSGVLHSRTVTDSAGVTDRASGTVTYAPLPSLTSDPQAFAQEVQRRINAVHDAAQKAHKRVTDETEAREAADRQLRSDLSAQIVKVEGMSRSIAVGGLREQVVGWSCIAVGFILQAISTFLQATATS
jgi:hypothetical protein